MSALAVAPLDPTAPGRRLEGTTRPRRRLGPLLLVSTQGLSRNRLPARLLNSWDRALDAGAEAFDAVEGMNVYGDAELRRCRQRLREERRWLAQLRETSGSPGYRRFAHVRKSPYDESAPPRMRLAA